MSQHKTPRSLEHRQKLAKANRGKIVTEETRKRQSESAKRAYANNPSLRIRPPCSEEKKRKIAESNKGKCRGPHSEATKQKIALSHKGKKRSPFSLEHRQRLSKALKGRKPSEKTLQASILACKGKRKSTEIKSRISETLRKRDKMKSFEFYVYIWLDPRKLGKYVYGNYEFDHEPIYVGKGKGGRLNDLTRHWNPILRNKM